MDAEKQINMKLDPNIQIYRSFHDPEWAKALMALTKGTKLDDPATALTLSWFSTANAHAMPWHMVRTVIAFEIGFVRGVDSFMERLLQRLDERIPQKMGAELSNMKRRRLAEVIKEVGAEYQVEMATIPPTDAQELFTKLLNGSDGVELQTSIVASQKNCYGAMYYAYEAFLTTCVGIARGDTDYRSGRFKEFRSDVAKAFGQATVDVCFDDVVDIARLARNAMAHNGGRMTEELAKKKPDFPVGADGTMFVVAAHNHNLFNALKVRAYKLAETAVNMPPFR